MTNINPDKLGTPIYLKTEIMEWPSDKMFYLLAKEGMFICRNHQWFRSCAPAKRGLGELEEQKPFLELAYPKIPQSLMEQAVGFFSKVYEKTHWESALLLVWNRDTKQVELLCPDQKASWGTVKYEIPNLPPNLQLIGDLHSHGSMSPDPSKMDEDDELARPGIHGVVGWINDEPPKLYFAGVVDGQRFKIENHAKVLEGYDERVAPELVPEEWMAKIKEHKYEWAGGDWHGSSGYGGGFGGGASHGKKWELSKDDKDIITHVLNKFTKAAKCPLMEEVRQELYIRTKGVPYLDCEKEAKKFVKAWGKEHHEAAVGKE